MKTERLLGLIVLLLSRRQMTAKEMSQHFQVSQRTIYRDMITLENAGFPVIAHHGNEGGYQLMDGFKLHSYTFSEVEKAWLLNVLNMQEELLTETVMGRGIIDKLRLLAMSEPADYHVSLEQATLHRKQIEDETKAKLVCLDKIIAAKHKGQIDYVSADGQKTSRKINPWQLRLSNGSWYLLAFCELRQGDRMFKLTRIRHIQVLDEQQTVPLNQLQASKEIEKELVECHFSANQLGKLYDFFTDEDMRPLESGAIQVSFEEDKEKNLLPFLLMFGDSVKVIAPETLRQAHLRAIEAMKNNYLD